MNVLTLTWKKKCLQKEFWRLITKSIFKKKFNFVFINSKTVFKYSTKTTRKKIQNNYQETKNN